LKELDYQKKSSVGPSVQMSCKHNPR